MFRCSKKAAHTHRTQHDTTDSQCLFRMPLIPKRFASLFVFRELLVLFCLLLFTSPLFVSPGLVVVLRKKNHCAKLNIYNLVIIFWCDQQRKDNAIKLWKKNGWHRKMRWTLTLFWFILQANSNFFFCWSSARAIPGISYPNLKLNNWKWFVFFACERALTELLHYLKVGGTENHLPKKNTFWIRAFNGRYNPIFPWHFTDLALFLLQIISRMEKLILC